MDITFHLPADFVLPSLYERGDSDLIAMALRLGAEAVDQLYTKAITSIREETHEQATQKLEAEFAQREEKKAREIQLLKEKLATLECLNSTWQSSMMEKAETLIASRLKDKDSQIETLQHLLTKREEDFGTKVERLTESIYKTMNNSSLKGKAGELQVEELLKIALDCEVYKTNKEAYAGDYHLLRGKGKYKYLVDAKNYDRPVNRQEVEKMHRDLRLNADMMGGIFISLNQGIVGHSRAGDLDIEFLETGKPIVYLGNVNRRMEPILLFTSLRPFFEVVERMMELKKEENTEESDTLQKWQTKTTLVAALVRTHLDEVVKSKHEFTNNKKKIEAIFADIHAKMLKSEGSVRNILEIVMGNEEHLQTSLRDTETPLPSFVFSKQTRAELTEKEAKFVSWLEKTYTFEEGKDTDVKSFLEKAAAQGFSEKETRGMREKLFTEEAWPKLAKKIRGLNL